MRTGVMGKIGIGLGLGLSLVTGLHFCLQETPAEAATSSQPEALQAAAPLPPGLPRGRAMLLYLLAPDQEPAANLAPLARLLPGGALRLLRGAPPARHPEDGELWLTAGVILPAAELSRLDPRERAVLLNLLSTWSEPEGLELEQIEGRGIRFRPGELRGLLRWLR